MGEWFLGGFCSPTMNFFLTQTFLPLLTGIEAIKQINKTIEKGDPKLTLETLQSPEAKLQDVFDAQDYRYQVLLVREKNKKLEVKAKQNHITALFSNTTYFRWRCFISLRMKIKAYKIFSLFFFFASPPASLICYFCLCYNWF